MSHCKCTVTLYIFISFKKEGGGNVKEIPSVCLLKMFCIFWIGDVYVVEVALSS